MHETIVLGLLSITHIKGLAYVLLESPEIGVIFICTLDLVFLLLVFLLTAFYQKHKKRKKIRR